MRIALVLAAAMVAACASEHLRLEPPAGVNFSGHWQLNEADSDDPLHLSQSEIAGPAAGSATSGGSGGPGGSERGSRRGGSNGGMGVPGGLAGPAMPSVSALGEALRWPGKLLEIKQVAGVVVFISDGRNRHCQPTDREERPHRRAPAGRNDDSRRDRSSMGRDVPPPVCGWEDKTLIVRGGDPGDDLPPYEEHYGISEDGRRLVEVVSFKGGRSSGFTMSRVWDRLP